MARLMPMGGNDRVMTPPDLARRIVEAHPIEGVCLEPARGAGAFYDCLPHGLRRWCEIDEGRDFMKVENDGSIDWVVTNPPFSKWRAFWQQSMHVSNNVLFLTTLNHLWLKARIRDMREMCYGIRRITLIHGPIRGWPQSGFQVGTVWAQRDWKGECEIHNMEAE